MRGYIPHLSEMLNVARSRGAESQAPGLWRGLVGAWPMQAGGGSTAFDVSGYGNHGTLTTMDPATDWVVSPYGRALDFDGSNDYIAVPALASLFGTEATLSMWLKLDADPPAGSPQTGLAALGTSAQITHYPWNADGKVYLAIFHSARVINGVDNSAFDKAQWHHLAITTKPGANNYLVYQNGDVAMTGTGPASISMATSPKLGESEGAAGYSFHGRMGPVALYNRALPASEIADLYAHPWGMLTLRRGAAVAAPAAGYDTDLASLLNIGVPWYNLLPNPDGSLDQGDRQHLINLYSGIEAGAAAGVTLLDYERGFGRGFGRGVAVGAN